MKTLFRSAFPLLVVLTLFAACLEYEDELTVFPDGSAEHRLLIGQSNEFEEMVGDMGGDGEVEGPAEDLSSDVEGEGVTLISSNSYSETRTNAEGQQVEWEFEEVTARYENLTTAPYFTESTGEVIFEPRGGGYYFRRTLLPDSLGDGSQDPAEAAQASAFMQMLFPDATLRFIVEMPSNISSANVTGLPSGVSPETSGRRMVLEIPFAETMALRDDIVIEIESE